MNRKGFVSIIEMIITAAVLLTAFSLILPKNVYKTNWDRSQIILDSRDMASVIDNLGKLYDYAYDQSAFTTFISSNLPQSIIAWIESNGLIKSDLTVACNCTSSQIDALNEWLYGMNISGRVMTNQVCSTNLDQISSCDGRSPDVLVIWGYMDLQDANILNTLFNFLSQDKGIVEIADLPNANLNILQNPIFGIKICSDIQSAVNCNYQISNPVNDAFTVPKNASVPIYISYKYFYHIPMNVNSSTFWPLEIPGDPGVTLTPCNSPNIYTGTFRFYETSYAYWICSAANSVYFDTDASGYADLNATSNENFKISGFNFSMKYVNLDNFGVIFNPTYEFKDFLSASSTTVYPYDENEDRVLLSYGNYQGSTYPVPVVIVNNTAGYKTAWISDFTRGGLGAAGDDHKMLLMSLIYWASNKHVAQQLSNIAFGQTSTLIGTVDDDLYESFTFTLGLGQPY